MPPRVYRGPVLLQALNSYADSLEGKVRRAFLAAVKKVTSTGDLPTIMRQFKDGDVDVEDLPDRILQLELDYDEIVQVIQQAVKGAGTITAQKAQAEYVWDITQPGVITSAREFAATSITGINQKTVQTLADLIADAIDTGMHRDELIRNIKRHVGLLPNHSVAVSNYEQTLIGGGLPQRQIGKLVRQYTERLLDYRATMIARTEVAQAMNLGQQKFWEQMQQRGMLPLDTQRVWITADDERVCPICGPMDGALAPLNGDWVTDAGPVRHPADVHPQCRCAMGLEFTHVGKSVFEAVTKFNPYHDAQGRFTSADQAVNQGAKGVARYSSGYAKVIGVQEADARYGTTPAQVRNYIEKNLGVRVDRRSVTEAQSQNLKSWQKTEHPNYKDEVTATLQGIAYALETTREVLKPAEWEMLQYSLSRMKGVAVTYEIPWKSNVTGLWTARPTERGGYGKSPNPLTIAVSGIINDSEWITPDKQRSVPWEYVPKVTEAGKEYWSELLARSFSVAIHELGHALDPGLPGTKMRRKRPRLAPERNSEGRIQGQQVSRYATTNEAEWFAESFAAYILLGRRAPDTMGYGLALETITALAKQLEVIGTTLDEMPSVRAWYTGWLEERGKEVAKFNPYHDAAGRFTSAGAAVTIGAMPTSMRGTASHVAALASAKDGFTYDQKRGEFRRSGFAVSPFPEHEATFGLDEWARSGPELVKQYMADKSDVLAQPNSHVGGWKGEDRQGQVRIFLDVSVVRRDQDSAANLARRHAQISYFDLGRGFEMRQKKDKRYYSYSYDLGDFVDPDEIGKASTRQGGVYFIAPRDARDPAALLTFVNTISDSQPVLMGSEVSKFNPYHDVQGRFTSADQAVNQGAKHVKRYANGLAKVPTVVAADRKYGNTPEQVMDYMRDKLGVKVHRAHIRQDIRDIKGRIRPERQQEYVDKYTTTLQGMAAALEVTKATVKSKEWKRIQKQLNRAKGLDVSQGIKSGFELLYDYKNEPLGTYQYAPKILSDEVWGARAKAHSITLNLKALDYAWTGAWLRGKIEHVDVGWSRQLPVIDTTTSGGRHRGDYFENNRQHLLARSFGTMVHEIGHALDPDDWDTWGPGRETPGWTGRNPDLVYGPQVSRYARENVAEWFAESWSAFVLLGRTAPNTDGYRIALDAIEELTKALARGVLVDTIQTMPSVMEWYAGWVQEQAKEVSKFNPYHDAQGRFSSANAAVTISGGALGANRELTISLAEAAMGSLTGADKTLLRDASAGDIDFVGYSGVYSGYSGISHHPDASVARVAINLDDRGKVKEQGAKTIANEMTGDEWEACDAALTLKGDDSGNSAQRVEHFVAGQHDLWASTAGDHRPEALAVQVSAAQMQGWDDQKIADRVFRGTSRQEVAAARELAKRVIADAGGDDTGRLISDDTFAREGIYEAWYKMKMEESGGKPLVFTQMRASLIVASKTFIENELQGDAHKAVLAANQRVAQRDLKAVVGNAPTITLFRGVKMEMLQPESYQPREAEFPTGGTIRSQSSPLSSWSVSRIEADEFAGRRVHGEGVLIRADVPVSSIVGLSSSGFGCLVEGEAIVNGDSFTATGQVMGPSRIEMKIGEPVPAGGVKKAIPTINLDSTDANQDWPKRTPDTYAALGLPSPISKFNPYHDAQGRFSSADAAATISGGALGANRALAAEMLSYVPGMTAAGVQQILGTEEGLLRYAVLGGGDSVVAESTTGTWATPTKTEINVTTKNRGEVKVKGAERVTAEMTTTESQLADALARTLAKHAQDSGSEPWSDQFTGTPAEMLTQHTQNGWAHTAGDSQPDALAVQLAAAQNAGWSQKQIDERVFYNLSPKEITVARQIAERVISNAKGDSTQLLDTAWNDSIEVAIKELGVKSPSRYIAGSGASAAQQALERAVEDSPMPANVIVAVRTLARDAVTSEGYRAVLSAEQRATSKMIDSSGSDGTTITLYRGVKYDLKSVAITESGRVVWGADDPISNETRLRSQSAPLTAWSVSKNVAAQFSTYGTEGGVTYVIRADVPVSSIVGLSGLGFGCIQEGEVIVGPSEFDVEVVGGTGWAETSGVKKALPTINFDELLHNQDWTKQVDDTYAALGLSSPISKYNPYHDELGRFSSGPGGGAQGVVRTLATDTPLYRGSVNPPAAGSWMTLRVSPHGESGPGIYLSTDFAVAEKYARAKRDYRPGAKVTAYTTTRPLRLLDRSTPEGEELFRSFQWNPTTGKSLRLAPNEFMARMKAEGYDGVFYPGVTGENETVIYDASLLRQGTVSKYNPYHDELGRFSSADRSSVIVPYQQSPPRGWQEGEEGVYWPDHEMYEELGIQVTSYLESQTGSYYDVDPAHIIALMESYLPVEYFRSVVPNKHLDPEILTEMVDAYHYLTELYPGVDLAYLGLDRTRMAGARGWAMPQLGVSGTIDKNQTMPRRSEYPDTAQFVAALKEYQDVTSKLPVVHIDSDIIDTRDPLRQKQFLKSYQRSATIAGYNTPLSDVDEAIKAGVELQAKVQFHPTTNISPAQALMTHEIGHVVRFLLAEKAPARLHDLELRVLDVIDPQWAGQLRATEERMGAEVTAQLSREGALPGGTFANVAAFPGGRTYLTSEDGKPYYATTDAGYRLSMAHLTTNITTMPFGGMWGDPKRHESLAYLPPGGRQEAKNQAKTVPQKIQRTNAQHTSSGYGGTNGDELFAELFLEAVGSDSPRPAAAMLRAELDDLWAILQAEGLLG